MRNPMHISHIPGLPRLNGRHTLGLTMLLGLTAHAHAAPLPPNVENGRYLARAADCEVCHTAEGGTPYAGGRAFSLPGIGVMYAPHITPDKTAGIGAWTDQQFIRAVRNGVSPDRKCVA